MKRLKNHWAHKERGYYDGRLSCPKTYLCSRKNPLAAHPGKNTLKYSPVCRAKTIIQSLFVRTMKTYLVCKRSEHYISKSRQAANILQEMTPGHNQLPVRNRFKKICRYHGTPVCRAKTIIQSLFVRTMKTYLVCKRSEHYISKSRQAANILQDTTPGHNQLPVRNRFKKICRYHGTEFQQRLYFLQVRL